jgi:hypothetical protein
MYAVLANEVLATWKNEKIISEPCIIAWQLECPPSSSSFLFFAIVEKHIW